MKKDLHRYDAILVPGGGVLESGMPQPWVQKRLDRALELADKNCYIIALSGGTTHKPPLLDGRGFPVFESLVSANYLMAKGYDKTKILVEYHSYDTIGNAFFARTTHTEPRHLQRLAVVTSFFHMERTKMIFDWVFSLSPLPVAYEIDYFATENAGMDEGDLQSRTAGEKRRIESLEQVVNGIESIKDLHSWLFEHHNAYAVGGTTTPTSDAEINTY